MIATLFSTLINTAIVGTGGTAALWILLKLIPRRMFNAATRYALWSIALLLVVSLPIVFALGLLSKKPTPLSLGSLPIQDLALPAGPDQSPKVGSTGKVNIFPLNSANATHSDASEFRPVSNVRLSDRVRSFLPEFPIRVKSGRWMELILAVWLLSTLALLARLVFSFVSLSSRRRRAVDAPDYLCRALKYWLDQCEIRRRPVRILMSKEIDTPLAIGFCRPAILIPEANFDGFDQTDLEQVCVHEATHIGRGDDITLLLQRFVEALLPWHPAVRWIARQLDFEREVACDDWVVQSIGQTKSYALCLTRIAERGGAPEAVLTTPTVIGIRSDLARRVDSLLDRKDKSTPRLLKLRFVALSALLVMAAFLGGRVHGAIAFREPPQTRNMRVQEIIDGAPVAPPELAADVLLKLVERGEIAEQKLKRELLNEAWDYSSKARYPSQIAATIGVSTDSDIGSMLGALRPGFTTAQLQSRVIRQMVTLDPGTARELFLGMAPPELESPGCTADRYTIHDSYFEALRAVLPTFSDEENRNGDRARFLGNAIRVAANPRDLSASLLLIRQDTSLSDSDYVQLLNAWSESLAQAHFTDRVFVGTLPLSNAAIEAATLAGTRGGSPSLPLRALRSYLVRHAGAKRCEDGNWRPMPLAPLAPPTNAEETARLAFNAAISEIAPDILPIRAEEIKPSAIEGKAQYVEYLRVGDDSKSLQITNALKKLRFGTPEQQAVNSLDKRPDGMAPYLTLEQRSTPEWNRQALQFLTQLEAWTKELNESNRENFFQKSVNYTHLIYIAPDGKLRDTLTKSYLNFLVTSPIKRESPPEWFTWVSSLIGSQEVRDRKEWIDEIEASGDATIALYCKLERLRLDSLLPAR